MTAIRVHAVEPRSRANGPGARFVVWFQGCTLGCAGCFNPTTHDATGGREYTEKLANGDLSRRGVTQALAHSEEFRRRVPITNVLLSMHVSRSEFVAGLPPAGEATVQ